MKQCKDFLEQISAYADGELSSAEEIREVEAHLGECPSCAAFYAFSREISTVTAESSLPPPLELTSLVMNQIKHEPTLGHITPAEYSAIHEITSAPTPARRAAPARRRQAKQGNLRLIMTRLVPIAAGLALVVMVWQFWGDFGRVNYGVAPEAAMSLPLPAEAAPDVSEDAPEVAVDESLWRVEPEEEDLFGIHAADGVVRQVDPTDIPHTQAFHDTYDEDYSAIESTVAGGGEYTPPVFRGEHFHPVFYLEDEPHILFGHKEDLSEEELEYLNSHVAYASFVIAITGELPYFLNRFEPEPNVHIANWDTVFDLTTDQTKLLLSELAYGALEFEIIEQNINNPYAIVLFSRNPR